MVQLDALRALAVGGVLVQHTLPWAAVLLHPGEAGVRLFFVLSGFLITGILLRARAEAEAAGQGAGSVLPSFYARRFLRIFPLYYALLLASAAIGVAGTREPFGWNVAYLANWRIALLGDWPGAPNGHLWTLAVEEQFYLVWPALVLFTPRRFLAPVFWLTVLLGPLSRLLLACLGCSGVTTQVVTPSCLDTLGAGALLALFQQSAGPGVRTGQLPRVVPWAGLTLLLLVTTLRLHGRDWELQAACEDVAYALVFAWVVDRAAHGFGGRLGRVLEWRPLVDLGTISYGVYLLHDFVPPLILWTRHCFGVGIPLPGPGLPRLVLVTTLTIPLAALSWRFFERPLNELKRCFPYVPRHARGHASDPRKTA